MARKPQQGPITVGPEKYDWNILYVTVSGSLFYKYKLTTEKFEKGFNVPYLSCTCIRSLGQRFVSVPRVRARVCVLGIIFAVYDKIAAAPTCMDLKHVLYRGVYSTYFF